MENTHKSTGKRRRIIAGLGWVALVALLCWSIYYADVHNAEFFPEQAPWKEPVWETTPEGVRYYPTCIKGRVMIATVADNRNTTFSGPFETCEPVEKSDD